MDVGSRHFDFNVQLQDRLETSIGTAMWLWTIDIALSPQAKQILCYLSFVGRRAYDSSWGPRKFVISTLSLFLLRASVPSLHYSLAARHGIYRLTRLGLSAYVAALPPKFSRSHPPIDTREIQIEALEVIIYGLVWGGLFGLGRLLSFFFNPLSNLPSFVKAFLGAMVAEALVVSLATGWRPWHLWKPRKPAAPKRDWDAIDGPDKVSPISYPVSLTFGHCARVIKLLPKADNDEVWCEMEPFVDLGYEKSYNYEAISYTWGRSTEKAVIRLGGRRVWVPRKVRDMLSALRPVWHPRFLWIDYICINQDDNDEKAHQIQMMRHIYHHASSVLVWLGDAPDAKQAVHILAEIGRSVRFQNLRGPEGMFVYGTPMQQRRLAALGRLLRHDWFSRIWVVQEAAAARNLQILYGDQYIDWRDLVAAMLFFTHPETVGLIRRRENGDVGVDDFIRLNNASNLFEVRMQISQGVSQGLAASLHSLRVHGATDGRDKVFAVLGLIGNPQHPLILPNYNKTVEEVFTDAARYILTVENSGHRVTVLTLSGIGQYHSLQGAPSWVPNWSSSTKQWTSDTIITSGPAGDGAVKKDDSAESPTFYHFTPTLGGYRHWHTKSLLPPGSPSQGLPGSEAKYPHYRASLDTHLRCSVSSDSKVLDIIGFAVDEVVEMSSISAYTPNSAGGTPPTVVAMRYTSWLAEVDGLVAKACNPYPTGELSFDVLWRTLIGNRVVEAADCVVTMPAPAELADGFRNCRQNMENLTQRRKFYDSNFGKQWVSVCDEVRSRAIAGESREEYWLRLFCGQTEYSFVWSVLTGGKANKEGLARFLDTCSPPFHGKEAEAAFWKKKFQDFSEGEETSRIVRAWMGLLCYANPNMEEFEATPGFEGPLQMFSTMMRFSVGASISSDRRFCVTKRGYVGLVPPLTEIGDTVCILHGCETPFLIRPVEGPSFGTAFKARALLVGECYMHGMMDGEMMTSDRNETVFALE